MTLVCNFILVIIFVLSWNCKCIVYLWIYYRVENPIGLKWSIRVLMKYILKQTCKDLMHMNNFPFGIIGNILAYIIYEDNLVKILYEKLFIARTLACLRLIYSFEYFTIRILIFSRFRILFLFVFFDYHSLCFLFSYFIREIV